MHCEITLPEHVTQYLEALPYPVRVLAGSAVAFPAPRDWAGHVRGSGYSSEVCNSEGVTLISWGTDRVRNPAYPWQFHNRLDPHLTITGEWENYVGGEWIIPQADIYDEGSHSGPTDQIIWARAGARVVWFMGKLDSLPWDKINMDRFLGDPITFSREFAAGAAEREAAMAAAEQEAAAARAVAVEREREEQQARAREAFIQTARDAQVGNLSTMEQEVTRLEGEARRLEREHTQTMTWLMQQGGQLRLLKMADNFDSTQVEAEWTQLMQHPKITDVRMGPYSGFDNTDCLIVTTTALDITNPDNDVTHPLGRFDVYIPNATSGMHPGFCNLDGRRERRDHPHVVEGAACFGGIHAMVGDLVRSGSVAGLMEVMFQYLESFNPQDSYGQTAHLWGFNLNGDEENSCECDDCERERY